MEKIYKVRMYEFEYLDRGGVYQQRQRYTSNELIDLVNSRYENHADTIDDALVIIRSNNAYAQEVTVEFINDDFIANIKPDGTFTKRLDLGSFSYHILRSEYLIANFHKLLTEQQKVICQFIDKAEQLLIQINKEYDAIRGYEMICSKAKDILNHFVKERFTDFERPDTEAQIMNMRKFNEIDTEILFDTLDNIISAMPVANLMTDDSDVLKQYTDKFWHEIVVEATKNS